MSIDGGPRNVDETLDRVRGELADEVAADVRVPPFAGVVARRARRRRMQMTAGAAAVLVVAAGVVGGVAATRPGAHRSVPPAATVSVSPSPTASATAAPSDAQTYPAKGSSYVVVPDGDQLAWTDLKTGAHGHFGPTDGAQLSDPSVSADGRRVAFLEKMSGGDGEIDYWNLDTRTGGAVRQTPERRTAPAISPDGTRIIWAEGSGIHLVAIGDASSDVSALSATVGPATDGVTWDGNDAIAYLPGDRNNGGECAVMRMDLSAGASAHCLLPTATLNSVFAPDGSTWRIFSISGSGAPGRLALSVNAGARPIHAAIGLLDTSAEATPFRVLDSTFVQDFDVANVANPVLVDGGSRLLYESYPGGQKQSPYKILVISLDLATGAHTTVTTVSNMDGLGARSG